MKFSIDLISQYDNYSNQVGANLRVNYILREGTELIFVYNELADVSNTLSLRDDQRRSALLKFTYLWQF